MDLIWIQNEEGISKDYSIPLVECTYSQKFLIHSKCHEKVGVVQKGILLVKR